MLSNMFHAGCHVVNAGVFEYLRNNLFVAYTYTGSDPDSDRYAFNENHNRQVLSFGPVFDASSEVTITEYGRFYRVNDQYIPSA